LIFVGNDLRRKGIIDFIPVFKQHLSQICSLTIVTKAPITSNNKRIYIHRNITHENIKDLIKLYSNADLFILPSNSDMVPNVLIEAMFMELPIVAFNVGGISELVKDNYNGFLIKYDSERFKNMVKILNKISNNKSLLKNMGLRGKTMAKEIFRRDIFEKNITDSISKLLNSGRKK